MSFAGQAGAVLTIDLDAIATNYRLLRERAFPAECAAVVKADSYGLGANKVVPELLRAGCRTFFVATIDEGIAVRRALMDGARERSGDAEPLIYVLHGAPRNAETVVSEHRLIPVLNSLADVDAWGAYARRAESTKPAALHLDTGMSRLGLPAQELKVLVDDPKRFEGIRLSCVMSHLACADEPASPLNTRQLTVFNAARAMLPWAPSSLANSSGIFLGVHYHADMVRPGAALYGVAPLPGSPNPMRQVVRLQGKILQVREIDRGGTVGYGATHRAEARERIATVGVGYADGYLRALSNRGSGFIGGIRVPLVGRVSMDLITFDVTGVPEALARPGSTVDLIGPRNPIDAVAAGAGTIGYEILTGLGDRYHRVYRSLER